MAVLRIRLKEKGLFLLNITPRLHPHAVYVMPRQALREMMFYSSWVKFIRNRCMLNILRNRIIHRFLPVIPIKKTATVR